jgi:hypothetical protein
MQAEWASAKATAVHITQDHNNTHAVHFASADGLWR